MELYNIYHTMEGTGTAQYSPYSNETVDTYMDQALASPDLESSYELSAEGPVGRLCGVTQEGDIPGCAGKYRPSLLGAGWPPGGRAESTPPRTRVVCGQQCGPVDLVTERKGLIFLKHRLQFAAKKILRMALLLLASAWSHFFS